MSPHQPRLEDLPAPLRRETDEEVRKGNEVLEKIRGETTGPERSKNVFHRIRDAMFQIRRTLGL